MKEQKLKLQKQREKVHEVISLIQNCWGFENKVMAGFLNISQVSYSQKINKVKNRYFKINDLQLLFDKIDKNNESTVEVKKIIVDMLCL
jgi:hypothetical protein